MNNPLNKRLLWVSFALHILILLLGNFFCGSSRINRTFLAYGRHSKRVTQAYFRKLTAPKNNNSRYLQSRNLKPKVAARARRRPVKKIVKKPAPKKVLAKKKEAPKPVERRVDKKVVKKQEVIQQSVASEQEEIIHFNLMGETDPKLLMYQRLIQQEVDRVWSPPIGVKKGTECIVTFMVDKQGNVKRLHIERPSGVPIYDLSIVRDAKNLRLPFFKNKTFTLNFRQ